MNTPHRKLVKRYNDIGHAHFFTFSCWQRQKFLSSDRAQQWFIESLIKHDIACWAYVIMPEHAHLLVYPRQVKYNISKWLGSLKIGVNRLAVNYLKQHNPAGLARMADPQPGCKITYRFWQPGGGMDVNLWTEAKIWDKIDYIHNNPLRRRLVEKLEHWMGSSYRDYAQLGPGLIPIDWERCLKIRAEIEGPGSPFQYSVTVEPCNSFEPFGQTSLTLTSDHIE